MTEEERLASLLPVESLLAQHTRVTLDTDNAGRFLSGLRRRGPKLARRRPAWRSLRRPHPVALLGVLPIFKAGELIPDRPAESPIEITTNSGRQRTYKPAAHWKNMTKQIRNIAIIAHVDHGKTTMVDQLLRQSGTFADHEKVVDTVMDNNAIEKERGITILAKNCAVSWEGTHINIVDTPGHADFGGEVERALSMVDRCGAADRCPGRPDATDPFVTKKALALGLKPIVVVNKVDKPGANPDKVVNAAFDLFDKLGATDEQLDFPWCMPPASTAGLRWKRALQGEQWGPDMSALFNTVLKHVPAQKGDPGCTAAAADFRTRLLHFVGRIGVGRISQGTIKPMMDVLVMEGPDGKASRAVSTRC
jgi:small GTP-binding protein